MPENLVKISTATIQSNVSTSVNFTSIPTTYVALYLVGHLSSKGTASIGVPVRISANSVADSSNSAGGFIISGAISETNITSSAASLLCYASDNAQSFNSTFRAIIVGADDTSTYKSVLVLSGAYTGRHFIGSSTIATTSAISSLQISSASNFDGTSYITLYGLTS